MSDPPRNAPSAPDDDVTWSVWRRDDNGCEFRVSSGHAREEALAIVRTFEARGHEQTYWAARDGE